MAHDKQRIYVREKVAIDHWKSKHKQRNLRRSGWIINTRNYHVHPRIQSTLRKHLIPLDQRYSELDTLICATKETRIRMEEF